MKELNLLKKLESVKAPADFEQKVMAQLSLRKRKEQKLKHFRLSLAGAFSALFVFIIIMSIFIIPKRSPVEFAELEKGISSPFQWDEGIRQRNIIPIIEPVDYTEEMQTLSKEPATIYILEQVFEETLSEIKY